MNQSTDTVRKNNFEKELKLLVGETFNAGEYRGRNIPSNSDESDIPRLNELHDKFKKLATDLLQESYNQGVRAIADRVKEAVAYRVEEAFTLKYNLHEPENSDYNRGIDDMREMLDEGLDKVIDEQVTELMKGE